MSNPIIPLLNAQQQGMAPLVNALTTRAEVAGQAAQSVVAEIIREESKKLDNVEHSPKSSLVGDEEHSAQQEFTEQEKKHREPEEGVETTPSYHNPLAGHFLSTKV